MMQAKQLVTKAAALLIAAVALCSTTSCSVLKVLTLISSEQKSTSSQSSKEADDTTVEPPTSDVDGFVVIDNRTYFFNEGVLQKNDIVGNSEEGYFYAGSDGAIDYGYSDGVTIDGIDYIIINGKAWSVFTESDKALFQAAKDIAKCTETSMTKEEKLKCAFDYIKSNYLEGVRHNPPYRESDWPVVCANDIFVYGKGDCYSYGAAFAYYGKAIGCSDCYAVNSGGHGWAEIEGLVYDPEWSMHSDNYPYYAMTYDEKCDVPYKSSISDGAEWKRKEIVFHAEF